MNESTLRELEDRLSELLNTIKSAEIPPEISGEDAKALDWLHVEIMRDLSKVINEIYTFDTDFSNLENCSQILVTRLNNTQAYQDQFGYLPFYKDLHKHLLDAEDLILLALNDELEMNADESNTDSKYVSLDDLDDIKNPPPLPSLTDEELNELNDFLSSAEENTTTNQQTENTPDIKPLLATPPNRLHEDYTLFHSTPKSPTPKKKPQLDIGGVTYEEATEGLRVGPRKKSEATRDLETICKAIVSGTNKYTCQYNAIGELEILINDKKFNLTLILAGNPDFEHLEFTQADLQRYDEFLSRSQYMVPVTIDYQKRDPEGEYDYLMPAEKRAITLYTQSEPCWHVNDLLRFHGKTANYKQSSNLTAKTSEALLLAAFAGKALAKSPIDGCDVIQMIHPPTPDTLRELPILSNAAYLFYQNRLYYVNVRLNDFEEINVSPENLDKLIKHLQPSVETHVIDHRDFRVIESLTGHSHEKVIEAQIQQVAQTNPDILEMLYRKEETSGFDETRKKDLAAQKVTLQKGFTSTSESADILSDASTIQADAKKGITQIYYLQPTGENAPARIIKKLTAEEQWIEAESEKILPPSSEIRYVKHESTTDQQGRAITSLYGVPVRSIELEYEHHYSQRLVEIRDELTQLLAKIKLSGLPEDIVVLSTLISSLQLSDNELRVGLKPILDECKQLVETHTFLQNSSLLQGAKHAAVSLSQPYADLHLCNWDAELSAPPHGIIYRPNHGLAHSTRTASYVKPVTDYLKAHAKDPELKRYCENLSPAELELLQLAMLFSVSGRKCDLGFGDNKAIYQEYRRESARLFREYAQQARYYPPSVIEGFTDLVHYMGNPDYIAGNIPGKSPLPEDQRHLFHIMNIAHKLDLPRCFTATQCTNSFDKLNSIVDESDEQRKAFQSLVSLSTEMIAATGDRLMTHIDENGNLIEFDKDYHTDTFYKCSTDAATCALTCQRVITARLKITTPDQTPTFTPAELADQLHLAIENGCTATAKRLIDLGADLTLASKKGYTPVQLAVINSNTTLLTYLHEHHADLTPKTPFGLNLFHLATHQISSDMINSIASFTPTSGINEPAPGYADKTPLHLAIEIGNHTLAAALLNLGANPNALDRNGHSPLHYAIERGDYMSLTELMKSEFPLNINLSSSTQPISPIQMLINQFSSDQISEDSKRTMATLLLDPNYCNLVLAEIAKTPSEKIKKNIAEKVHRLVNINIDTLEQLANLSNNENLQFTIAKRYGQDISDPANIKKAFDWCLLAAQNGSINAQAALANHYSQGAGTPQDESKALFWLTLADANKGDKQAQHQLAKLYFEGRGTDKNLEEAFHWCESAARQGIIDAQKSLVVHYENGLGVAKNRTKANFWRVCAAATEGNKEQQFQLAKLFSRGHGTIQDTDLAIYWCEKSAEQGFSPAQQYLIKLYQSEKTKDEGRAAYWEMRYQAESGEANAQFTLAEHYAKNNDHVKAAGWYEKSALGGNSEAASKLSSCYIRGRGVDEDKKKGAFWHLLAKAYQNDSTAQFKLAQCYKEGFGVTADPLKAHDWCEAAAKNDHPSAKRELLQYKMLVYAPRTQTDELTAKTPAKKQ